MMNSQDLESSDSNSNDRADFERFQGIWNNIKRAKESSGYSYQDKQSGKKSVMSVKKAIEHEEHKNIQTRLILTEKQLKKSKENTALLLKKLSQAEEQIEYLEFELEKESKQNKSLNEDLLQYKKRAKQWEKHDTYEKSAKQDHQAQIQRISKHISLKDRQIDRLTLKVKSLEQSIKCQQKEIKLADQNSRIYQKKIQQTATQRLNNSQSGNFDNNRAGQLLQLQQASVTIERLAILLRSTEQYKNFAFGIQDLKDAHFLKNIPSRLKKNELICKLPARARSCCVQISIDEKLLWTPTACYKKVLQLKLKYESLTQPCIEELLFEINRIYQAKQDQSIRNTRDHYEGQIARLKKRTEMRYDQLVARKQIQRLKKQIHTEKYSKKSRSQENYSENLQILKSLGQYEDEIKLKQRENILLKQRIQLMQNENSGYDRMLYLEGTLWIIDKVLLQLEASSQDFNLFQGRFRDQISQNSNERDWVDSFKHFLQTVSEIQQALIQKILLMKQSTMKKMSNEKGSTGREPSSHMQSVSFR